MHLKRKSTQIRAEYSYFVAGRFLSKGEGELRRDKRREGIVALKKIHHRCAHRSKTLRNKKSSIVVNKFL